MLSVRKWLTRNRWLILVLLGLLSLSTVLIVAQHQISISDPAKLSATAPPSPVLPTPSVAMPTPPIAPAPKPTPAAKPTPKPLPQQTTLPKSNLAKPQLTPEEQEMNRRAKAAFLTSAGTVDSVIEMHVAIVEGVPALNMATSTAAALFDQQGNPLGELEPNAPYTAQTDGATIAIGAAELPAVVQIDPGPNGVFQIGDRTYRGRLVLVVHKGKIWGVNHVNLRKYLHSVVASEVSPSWHGDALKAQAIAARSYALTYYFRPVSSFYHLGDDEYYQVYSGVAREATETNQAVDQTAGEYVSYKGGIVESLYAASDDIVAEAFQGRGMSQLGAYDLAKQGRTYTQILSYYYPGTNVGKIVLDHE